VPTLLAKSAWGDETFEDARAGAAVAAVQETVRAVRNLRAESRVPEKEKIDVLVVAKAGADETAAGVASQAAQILRLCNASSLRVERAPPPKENASAVISLGDVFIDLAGKRDLAAERERLTKELAKAEATVVQTNAKLANANFVSRAKPEVVAQERRRLEEAQEQAARLRRLLDSLGG
jgi:valyl-tRNA synthetase